MKFQVGDTAYFIGKGYLVKSVSMLNKPESKTVKGQRITYQHVYLLERALADGGDFSQPEYMLKSKDE